MVEVAFYLFNGKYIHYTIFVELKSVKGENNLYYEFCLEQIIFSFENLWSGSADNPLHVLCFVE
jgi:hypothetical protein